MRSILRENFYGLIVLAVTAAILVLAEGMR